MQLAIPTLETERLNLRPFREDDVRLGETRRGETELWGHRLLVYRISRSEWEARQR